MHFKNIFFYQILYFDKFFVEMIKLDYQIFHIEFRHILIPFQIVDYI